LSVRCWVPGAVQIIIRPDTARPDTEQTHQTRTDLAAITGCAGPHVAVDDLDHAAPIFPRQVSQIASVRLAVGSGMLTS
jgi:hypothetical protein